MTYCIGMLVDEGLAIMADTRTNADVDNIASYRKLNVIDKPGERVIAVATSGNLSMTQMALALVEQGIVLHGETEPQTLSTAPTMFRAAELVGHAMLLYRAFPERHAEVLAAHLECRRAAGGWCACQTSRG